MLNSKRDKLKSLSTENEKLNELIPRTISAFEMPDILSTITTGLDVHQVDLDKLFEAPNEWNFYSPLSRAKMLELVESIQDLGLLHPIVVWEQLDGTYMILSGHNRKRAYEILLEETSDDKYKKIYCYVKKNADLTEDEAKEIIIDTNWVQRELSTVERAKSIYQKYTKLRNNRETKQSYNHQGKTRDLIASQYDITGRQVSDYYRLNYLIPEFKELLEDNKLSIKAGVRLAQFNTSLQKFIYNNYKDKLINKIILRLNPTFNEDDISETIEDAYKLLGEDMVKLSYKFMVSQDNKDKFESELNKLLIKYDISNFDL